MVRNDNRMRTSCTTADTQRELFSLRGRVRAQQRQIRAQERETAERRREEEKNQRLTEILGILSHHVGRQRAIGMGELYVRIFNKEWKNRINDTRMLRNYIELLRGQGKRICHSTDSSAGGYYIPATDSEWRMFVFSDIKKHALAINRDRLMFRISREEALRQVQMALEEGGNPGDQAGGAGI